MINYYKELGIESSLKGEEIKEALKKVQRKWVQRTNAPDQNRRQEAERKVTMIDEAFKILTDDKKRAEYDKALASNSTQNSEKREAIKVDGFNTSQLIDKAWNLINKGNYADAIMVARNATEIEGANAEAWATLGYADYLWNNIQEAVYEYKKAISLKPNQDSYYCDLGNIYLDINRYKEAEDCARKAMHINPDSMYNKSLMGTILYENGSYEEAMKILEELVEQDPNNNANRRVLAYCYYQKGLNQCLNSGDYYYCVEKKNTEDMITYMTKARNLYNDPEFDEKINWGKKNLRKKFDKSKWGIFIYPAMLLFSGEGLYIFLGIIVAAVTIFFSFRPAYEITRAELLNKKALYDYIAIPLHWISAFVLLFCWGLIKGMFGGSSNERY